MLCLHKTAIKKVKYFNMKADITGFTAHFTFSYYHCYLFFFFFSNQTHMHFPLNFTSRTITFAAGVMMNYGL